jgi:glutaredoxin-like YruB-family protein
MKVEIYSTPTCTYCDMAKKLFKKNNIEYIEYNVKDDLKKREEMVELTEQRGVPVIVIDGRWGVGYDENWLKVQLGL